MQMPVPMPFPAGNPMRLTAPVAGALSQMQGQFMAAQPEIQNAYAMHWLAFRHAGGVPAFQQLTQNMLWGAYSTLAMQGLLRHALSGRATPEVMAGMVDQARIMQDSYRGATNAMTQFLQEPDARDLPAVPQMAQSFRPLDRVYQGTQQPMETILQDVPWIPSTPLAMVNVPRAMIPEQTERTNDEIPPSPKMD